MLFRNSEMFIFKYIILFLKLRKFATDGLGRYIIYNIVNKDVSSGSICAIINNIIAYVVN
jgi:hypothetical protein